ATASDSEHTHAGGWAPRRAGTHGGEEWRARHDRVGLDRQIVFGIGGQEGVVALEVARACKAAGERREVAGDQLELANARGARHISYPESSAERVCRPTRSSTELTKLGSPWS